VIHLVILIHGPSRPLVMKLDDPKPDVVISAIRELKPAGARRGTRMSGGYLQRQSETRKEFWEQESVDFGDPAVS
jgi:hypothetical protein